MEMDRQHHSMMSSPPVDRFPMERPYGHQPSTSLPPIHPSHSQSPVERHHQLPPSPHNSNQSGSPGSSPTNSFLQGSQQTKRRRVPTEERKRTAMSCDRCKSRKIKVAYSSLRVLMVVCRSKSWTLYVLCLSGS
jgi:hypothetical protein